MTPTDMPATGPGQEATLKDTLSRVDSRRSFILLALGALTGLGIAGFGLFTAAGTASKVVPPEDVALVNQRPILQSDFIAQLESLYSVPISQATKEQKTQVLNDMIKEELLVQRATELDFAGTDPDVRAAMVAGVEQQVAANVTAATPKDEVLRAYYDKHRDVYVTDGSMTAVDLVIPNDPEGRAIAKAKAAAAAIRAGGAARAVELAAPHGLVSSKKLNGQEFNFAAKIHLGPSLYEKAAALKNGQVSEPIVEGNEVHVIAMIENDPSLPLSFEDARERATADYKREEIARVQNAQVKFLRSKAQILIQPEYR
jgi:parvulin-like peptidyl-prolyl isomerase